MLRYFFHKNLDFYYIILQKKKIKKNLKNLKKSIDISFNLWYHIIRGLEMHL